MKDQINKILLAVLVGSSFLLLSPFFVGKSFAQVAEEPMMPGRIQGQGTSFEIKDSQYLNISLQSSEEIKVMLQSIPKMITIMIEPVSSSSSSQIDISGLAASTNYFLYQDNFHNLTEFTSNEKGVYSFEQDISVPHFIFILSKRSTKFINDIDGGDCNSVGVWDTATRTCTFSSNVSGTSEDIYGTFQIDSDNIILDGASHTISGVEQTVALYIPYRHGITIKNFNIEGYGDGILFVGSYANTITGNNLSNNFYGIDIMHSNDTIIAQNTADSNYYSGILVYGGSGNTVENNISRNGLLYGILLDYSGNNTLSGNTTNSNDHSGILLGFNCTGNIITENFMSNNAQYGLYFYTNSNYNEIYHNNFISNNSQVGTYGAPDNLFNKDYPVGGNYWSDYTGVDEKSGPNQDQPGSDGIGDMPYVYSPWGTNDRYPFMTQNGWQTPAPGKWSFAIISDLHVGNRYPNRLSPDYGDSGWNDSNTGQEPSGSTDFLRQIIAQINSNKDKYNIKFVVVTGDFTDSAELSELYKAKEILDTLGSEIPWIPIIGNHDIWPYVGILNVSKASEVGADQNGTDKFFNDIFNSQYEKLRHLTDFQNWEKEDYAVWNPETDPNHYSYFQNFSFDYNGYHFIGLDFNNRDDAFDWPWGALPEGNLHNFVGGTWNWLLNNLSQYTAKNPDKSENIILLTHHPFRKDYWQEFYDFKLYNIGFSDQELRIMGDSLVPYWDKIYALFAGHTHKTKESPFFGAIMPIVETGANVDNPLARIVQFYPDKTIDYSTMLRYGVIIQAHSPVDLKITDPKGLVISKQINQIPGAVYLEEDTDGDGDLDDWVGILDRKLGNYQIEVIPDQGADLSETYSLDVTPSEDSFGYLPATILALDVPLSDIPANPYVFHSKEKQATQLVYSGNLSGQYSDSVNLSAVLTDASNNPLVNKSVTFKIGEQSVSAITDSNGVASASLILNQAPSKDYSVEASFIGDEDYLPSSGSKDFEILKENIVVNVLDKEGFAFDKTVLEAGIKDEDGQVPLPGLEVEFKIGSRELGMTQIDGLGIASSSWQVDLIPKGITESYPIEVIFAGNDYYQPAQGQANFLLKSAKWLKQEAVSELEAAKTGNWLNNLEIEAAKKLIQDSLSSGFWVDASHLIFFEKNCSKQGQSEIDPDKIDPQKLFDAGNINGINKNCSWFESGLRVFGDEYLATKLLQKKIANKPIIGKLTKADQLLAKVALYDAENAPVKNPNNAKTVGLQISKAKEQLIKAEQESSDKAIIRLAISWLRSQLAIKFANL